VSFFAKTDLAWAKSVTQNDICLCNACWRPLQKRRALVTRERRRPKGYTR
jgi:hypothetical protein